MSTGLVWFSHLLLMKTYNWQINPNVSSSSSSRFPKPKDEGWFLILGCVEDKELLALKRVAPSRGRGVNQQQLSFYTPEAGGRVVYTLYVVSDCYLGLDQMYELCLDVEEGFSEVSRGTGCCRGEVVRWQGGLHPLGFTTGESKLFFLLYSSGSQKNFYSSTGFRLPCPANSAHYGSQTDSFSLLFFLLRKAVEGKTHGDHSDQLVTKEYMIDQICTHSICNIFVALK